jgi:hypothetical protein
MSDSGLPVSGPQIPSTDEFVNGWELFFAAVAAVCADRARRFGPAYFAQLAEPACRDIRSAAREAEFRAEVRRLLSTARDSLAAAILYEEFLYYAWMHRDLLSASDQAMMPELTTVYSGEVREPSGMRSLEAAEVIKGSIETVLDKLPRWLHRLIDVAFEVLRLTKGGA